MAGVLRTFEVEAIILAYNYLKLFLIHQLLLQDLSGGNSNDSSGGPAPGTPNSQGMRPTPSPTGSTGSRSMSPAVGKLINNNYW